MCLLLCIDIDECSMFSPCQHECANTNGSYRCSCRNGYTLGNDNTTCRGNDYSFFLSDCFTCILDVNECMLAALNGNSLCSVNSECVNTHGSYECVCVPGYDLTNGTCHSMLHDCVYVLNDRIASIGIEEVPSTPPQIVPNFAQENTYIYTIASLDITVRINNQFVNYFINRYCVVQASKATVVQSYNSHGHQ